MQNNLLKKSESIGWNQMRGILDKEMPIKKKKDRYFILWFFGGILLIGFLAFIKWPSQDPVDLLTTDQNAIIRAEANESATLNPIESEPQPALIKSDINSVLKINSQILNKPIQISTQSSAKKNISNTTNELKKSDNSSIMIKDLASTNSVIKMDKLENSINRIPIDKTNLDNSKYNEPIELINIFSEKSDNYSNLDTSAIKKENFDLDNDQFVILSPSEKNTLEINNQNLIKESEVTINLQKENSKNIITYLLSGYEYFNDSYHAYHLGAGIQKHIAKNISIGMQTTLGLQFSKKYATNENASNSLATSGGSTLLDASKSAVGIQKISPEVLLINSKGIITGAGLDSFSIYAAGGLSFKNKTQAFQSLSFTFDWRLNKKFYLSFGPSARYYFLKDTETLKFLPLAPSGSTLFQNSTNRSIDLIASRDRLQIFWNTGIIYRISPKWQFYINYALMPSEINLPNHGKKLESQADVFGNMPLYLPVKKNTSSFSTGIKWIF